MRMCPANRVIRMTSIRTIRNRPQPILLKAIVRKGFAIVVLTKPYSLGDAVLETNHVVLPVADVVTDWEWVDGVAQDSEESAVIKGVEVHVVDVDEAGGVGGVVVDYYSAADGVVGLAGAVGFDAVEVGGVCCRVGD